MAQKFKGEPLYGAVLTESVVSACDPPCLNGGTCYAKSLNETYKMYLCSCTEAFYGDSCEKERGRLQSFFQRI